MYRDAQTDHGWEAPLAPGHPAPARQPLLRRLLREPLTHFVAIGIGIFVISHVIEERQSRYNLTLTNADVLRIANSYAQQYGAQATPEQMRTMIDNAVREEIYLREGLALGLDRNDEIVRRRIAQKFDFLQQDQAAPREPSEAQLRGWYGSHRDRFAAPAKVSFEQRYFAPDQRGDAAARALATSALAHPETAPGDTFPGPPRIVSLARDDVDRVFGGTGFAANVFAAPTDRWTGPFRSGFGWHLVRVTEHSAAHPRSFDEARADVRSDWIEADRKARNDQAWQQLRARYTVTVPQVR
ncbi:peptidyl-prolyl cis-trans isomerase [Novosphingobium olei]|uniref:peptidyl-prolyl cis-trans isomerase n=1 Tax=Novosphingobium olei TaxID=2728851 RepID=UPI00308F45FE|nr:peptidylprolyl isomerase [Novosphingobium olei]